MQDATIEGLQRSVLFAKQYFASLNSTNAASPTPCPAMDARTLAAHVIGGLLGFSDVAQGRELRFDLEPDLSTEDPNAVFDEAAAAMLKQYDGPALEATFTLPWGPMTGRQIVGFAMIELLVHGWDLARALGIDSRMPQDLAAEVLEQARVWVDDSARVPGLFGPEVRAADDADATDRLVAFLGREPSWSPPER